MASSAPESLQMDSGCTAETFGIFTCGYDGKRSELPWIVRLVLKFSHMLRFRRWPTASVLQPQIGVWKTHGLDPFANCPVVDDNRGGGRSAQPDCIMGIAV